MKIFLLKAIGTIDYDSYDSFVVRANDEKEAREFVTEKTNGDEQDNWIDNYKELIKVPFWLEPQYSTCEEVSTEGETKILCSSYNAG